MNSLELTPVDIRHKEFTTGFTGYKKEEVREFLELVSAQMEDILNKKDKAPSAAPAQPLPFDQPTPAAEPQKPPMTEDLISRTLILAEQTKSDILKTAQQQAENIIKSAEIKAKKTIEEARHYLNVLEHQYVNIKEQKKSFLLQFRNELTVLLDRINNDSILKRENEKTMDEQFSALKVGKETAKPVKSVLPEKQTTKQAPENPEPKEEPIKNDNEDLNIPE